MGAHALRIAPALPAADEGDAVFTVATPRLIVRAEDDGAAGLNCVIRDKATARRLGWISFSRMRADAGAIQIAFFIEAPDRARGLMREAMHAAVSPAFACLKPRVVQAQLRADDRIAIAVVRGIGLRRSGKAYAARCVFEKDLCGIL